MGRPHCYRFTDDRWTKKLMEWRPHADIYSEGRLPRRWSIRPPLNWIAEAQESCLGISQLQAILIDMCNVVKTF